MVKDHISETQSMLEQCKCRGLMPLWFLVLIFVCKTMSAVSYFCSKILVLSSPTETPAEENNQINMSKTRIDSI